MIVFSCVVQRIESIGILYEKKMCTQYIFPHDTAECRLHDHINYNIFGINEEKRKQEKHYTLERYIYLLFDVFLLRMQIYIYYVWHKTHKTLICIVNRMTE